MTDQILTKPNYTIQYFAISAQDNYPNPRPLKVTAGDFGYEIDEQELADELLAPFPDRIPKSAPPEIAPEDFEETYHWYLA